MLALRIMKYRLVFLLLFVSAFSACHPKPSPEEGISEPSPVESAGSGSSVESAGSGSSAVKSPVAEGDSLISASLQGDIKKVRRLLSIPAVQKNINARTSSGTTALEMTIQSEEKNAQKITEMLIKAGADPIMPDEDGDTLLINMAFQGNETAVRRLLSIPAVRKNINTQGKIWTALSAAAYNGHLKTAEALVKAGADPTFAGQNGRTPLIQAANQDKPTMVRWLLSIPEVREHINARTSSGRTALEMTIQNEEKNAQKIAEMLVKAGADPTLAGQTGRTPLMRAANQDKPTMVRWLLSIPEVREHINARTSSGRTALEMTIQSEETNAQKITEMLVKAGADPIMPDEDGDTLLINTVFRGNETAVRRLLSVPAVRKNINAQGKIWTALSAAAYNGQLKTAEMLVKAGADPTLAGQNGWTPLINAANQNKPTMVRWLLSIPAVQKNINARSSSGETALEMTIQSEETNAQKITEMLVKAGADPIMPDEDGDTLLINTVFRGNETAVRRLLSVPAVRKNINAQGELWTALSAAAYRGHLKTAEALVKAGADPTLAGQNGRTPLINAANKDKPTIVRWLLSIPEVREHINARSSSGATALEMTIQSEETNAQKITEMLIKAGADPVMPDEDGDTLLINMAFQGNETAVRRLLSVPAVRKNINAQGESWTALSVAARNGHLKTAEALVKAGADPTLAGQNGWTPLINAANQNKPTMVRWLLSIPEVREHINFRDENGTTALSRARAKDFQEIVDLLIEAGAVADTGQKIERNPPVKSSLRAKTDSGEPVVLKGEKKSLRGMAHQKKSLFGRGFSIV